MSTKNALLFVCAGNTCRSPAAAKILAEILTRQARHPENLIIDSGGLRAVRGQPASQSMSVVLGRRGLDLSAHRSRPLEDLDLDLYTLVLVMEPEHRQDLLARFPGLHGKVFLLAEMSGGQEGIEDPFGADERVYEQTVRQIELLIEKGLPRIVELAADEQ